MTNGSVRGWQSWHHITLSAPPRPGTQPHCPTVTQIGETAVTSDNDNKWRLFTNVSLPHRLFIFRSPPLLQPPASAIFSLSSHHCCNISSSRDTRFVLFYFRFVLFWWTPQDRLPTPLFWGSAVCVCCAVLTHRTPSLSSSSPRCSVNAPPWLIHSHSVIPFLFVSKCSVIILILTL